MTRSGNANANKSDNRPARSSVERIGALLMFVVAIPVLYATGTVIANVAVFHPAAAPFWNQTLPLITSLLQTRKFLTSKGLS
jgi:hypothetical protein